MCQGNFSTKSWGCLGPFQGGFGEFWGVAGTVDFEMITQHVKDNGFAARLNILVIDANR